MHSKSGRPSPAMVVALVALFVALGGTGYAASSLTGGNSASQAKKKKKKKTTRSRGPRGERGSVGPVGPQGQQGTPGAAGAKGTALAYARVLYDGATASIDGAQSGGMGGAVVTKRAISAFCFANLPFVPHHAVVSSDYAKAPGIVNDTEVQVTPGGQADDCDAGEQVEVATATLRPAGPQSVPFGFYILFTA